jgi:hypothetical protein
MTDLTYTANGTYDRNGIATINICIPAPPTNNSYRTELHNLSKITSSGSINVIFCHFTNGQTVPLRHNSFDYRMGFDVNNSLRHPGAVDFDETLEEALFIFFHDEIFSQIDRTYFFNHIEELYPLIKQQGNQNQDVLLKLAAKSTTVQPRKVGLSLVIKR